MRTSKTVNGATTSFVYDGMNIVMENVGGSRTQYIRGVNLISQRSASGESYLLYNTHGDVVKEIGGNGTAAYDAFGNVRSGNLNSPFGYAGEYTDAESGLIYLRARYYDPATSRMLSEDPYWNSSNMIYGDNPSTYPIPNTAAIVQSSNRYVYALNNPLRYVDPSGESASVVVGGAVIFLSSPAGQQLLIEAQHLGLTVANYVNLYGPQAVNIVATYGGAALDAAGQAFQWASDKVGEGVNNAKNWLNEKFPKDPLNLNKVKDNYLKKQGINAHDIKREYLGNSAKISRYDLYADKNTGQIFIVEKATKTITDATWYYIK